MYSPDLSPADERIEKHFRLRSWENYDLGTPLLLVGWLDKEQPYTKGVASPQFIEALRALCQNPVAQWKGSHSCPFCGGNPVIEAKGEHRMYGEHMMLGNADIEVVGEDAAYYAPAMTLHYVEKHEYLPPERFMDAVLAAKERESQTPKISHRGRVRGKEDSGATDVLSNAFWGDDFWPWPLENKPNEDGLTDMVDIFRHELFALLVQKELRDLGRTSVIGEMNLEEWIEGKVSLKMGELRETNPQFAYPRIKSAFYLRTMSNPMEMLECIVAAQEALYQIVFDVQNGTGQSVDTWVSILRESANE